MTMTRILTRILTSFLLLGLTAPTFAQEGTISSEEIVQPARPAARPAVVADAPSPVPAPTHLPVRQSAPGNYHNYEAPAPAPVITNYYTTQLVDDRQEVDAFGDHLNGRSVRRNRYGVLEVEGVSSSDSLAAESMVASGAAKVRDGRIYMSPKADDADLDQAERAGLGSVQRAVRDVRSRYGQRLDTVERLNDEQEQALQQHGKWLQQQEEQLQSNRRGDQRQQQDIGLLTDMMADQDRVNWTHTWWLVTIGLVAIALAALASWMWRTRLRQLPGEVAQLRADVGTLVGRVDGHDTQLTQLDTANYNGRLDTAETAIQAIEGRLSDPMTGLAALDQRGQMLRQELATQTGRIDRLEGDFTVLEQRQTALGGRLDQGEASDADVRAFLVAIAQGTNTPLPTGWQQPTPTP